MFPIKIREGSILTACLGLTSSYQDKFVPEFLSEENSDVEKKYSLICNIPKLAGLADLSRRRQRTAGPVNKVVSGPFSGRLQSLTPGCPGLKEVLQFLVSVLANTMTLVFFLWLDGNTVELC